MDLLLTNANVLTMDPRRPRAGYVAIRGGVVSAVGEEVHPAKQRGKRTLVIDLGGKTLVPGFIDAHIHLRALAESLVTVNVFAEAGVRSIAQIQDKIRRVSKALPPGAWIRAGAYHEALLKENRHPNRWDLDKAAPEHPVKLTHRSGHAHVLNSLGLKRVGISVETEEPRGGIIERDLDTGEPDGLLFGLGDLLAERIPPLEERELETGVRLAGETLLASGITSIQDASHRNDLERFCDFARWMNSGALRCRVTLILGLEGLRALQDGGKPPEIQPKRLRIQGVKIIIEETTGRLSPCQDELNEIVSSIHESGGQLVIHAIEQTAIEAACNAIERALRKRPLGGHRHRVEHCSVCPPGLAERLSSLGVFVVTHPGFVYFNGERYLKTVPPSQFGYLYPIATLLGSGLRVAAGSDAPMAPANPLLAIYAAVTRRTQAGRLILPAEGVSPAAAISMHTRLAAMCAFEERAKGSIRTGALADFAILSEDPTTVPPERIKDIRVEMTIVGGEVVWTKEDRVQRLLD